MYLFIVQGRRSSLEVQDSSALWAAGRPGPQAGRELLKEEPDRESRYLDGAAQMEQKLQASGSISPRLGSNSPKRYASSFPNRITFFFYFFVFFYCSTQAPGS